MQNTLDMNSRTSIEMTTAILVMCGFILVNYILRLCAHALVICAIEELVFIFML